MPRTNSVISAQSASTEGAARPSGFLTSATSSAEPFRPACPSAAMSMRFCVSSAGSLTIAPTPPETPRVFSSKSVTLSKMPVQLKMRWSLGFFELKLPSRLVDWRGPRAK
jgi:hypothetical protein